MTKLDLVLERIRQLPQERQDIIAVEMEFWLDHDGRGNLLSDEQWAEVAAELANPEPELIPHEQVVVEMERKFGR